MYLLPLTLTLTFLLSGTAAQSFISSYEAHTQAGTGLCLGDCLYVNDQARCVVNYRGESAACVATDQLTKHYRTVNNEECYSNCGFFDGESYQWCVTRANGKFGWDYCNRRIALKAKVAIRTDNRYMTCDYTTCGKHTFSYNWCGTIGTYWEYCDPEEKVVLINYQTSEYTECATPCELTTDKTAYCYDTNYDWLRCYLNPLFHIQLNNVHVSVSSYSPAGGVFSRRGYKSCTFKRANDANAFSGDTSRKEATFFHPLRLQKDTYSHSVQNVAKLYANNNPTVTVRAAERRRDFDFSVIEPVVSYTLLPIPNPTAQRQLNLPLVVNAIITNYTLQTDKHEPRNFSPETERHMDDMHGNYDHVNFDEPAFILGFKLGGSTELYNIFPQPWQYNRGEQNRWRSLNSAIEVFLINGEERYAEFTAVLTYAMLDAKLVHRPTMIAVRVRFYENHLLVDAAGQSISFEENPMENMYFSNNPRVYCVGDT